MPLVLSHAAVAGVIAVSLSLCPLAAQSTSAPRDSVALRVEGSGVPAPRTFSFAALASFGHAEVRVRGHHDTASVTYSGVALSEILRAAGAWSDGAPRGAFARSYVLVTAADGYRAIYALAELDTMVTDKVVLLADRRDGAPLDGTEGPLRLVAPGEKREGRWVRQVKTLVVERADSRQ